MYFLSAFLCMSYEGNTFPRKVSYEYYEFLQSSINVTSFRFFFLLKGRKYIIPINILLKSFKVSLQEKIYAFFS